MTDIRLNVTFRDHRKRKRLFGLLGAAGVLSLIDLWLAVAENRPDGTLRGMDATDIELDANWTGEKGVFVSACLECGLLEQVDGAYVVHDWATEQPWVTGAPSRSEHARIAAVKRWASPRKAKRMPRACPEHAGRMPELCPSPLLSLPIQKTNTIPPLTPEGVVGVAPVLNELPKNFKAWTQDQFRQSVDAANHDAMLTTSEVQDFCAYWFEPTASGRERFKTQDTWDTRRRMNTAVSRVYSHQRQRRTVNGFDPNDNTRF